MPICHTSSSTTDKSHPPPSSKFLYQDYEHLIEVSTEPPPSNFFTASPLTTFRQVPSPRSAIDPSVQAAIPLLRIVAKTQDATPSQSDSNPSTTTVPQLNLLDAFTFQKEALQVEEAESAAKHDEFNGGQRVQKEGDELSAASATSTSMPSIQLKKLPSSVRSSGLNSIREKVVASSAPSPSPTSHVSPAISMLSARLSNLNVNIPKTDRSAADADSSHTPFNPPPLLSSRSTRRDNFANHNSNNNNNNNSHNNSNNAHSASTSAANTARQSLTHRAGFLSQRTARILEEPHSSMLVSKSVTKLPMMRSKSPGANFEDCLSGATESTRSGSGTVLYYGTQRTGRSNQRQAGAMTEALRNLGRRLGQRFVAPDAWKLLLQVGEKNIGAAASASSTNDPNSQAAEENSDEKKITKGAAPIFFLRERFEQDILDAAMASTDGCLGEEMQDIMEDVFRSCSGANGDADFAASGLEGEVLLQRSCSKLFKVLVDAGSETEAETSKNSNAETRGEDKFSALLRSLEYPPSFRGKLVLDAVTNRMRKIHFLEEKILHLQRRRDVLKATHEQRLKWVIELVTMQLYRILYSRIFADFLERGYLDSLDGFELVKELIQMVCQIQTLDKSAFHSDKMHSFSRISAFQLTWALKVALDREQRGNGEKILDAFFGIDGGTALSILFNYFEGVLEEWSDGDQTSADRRGPESELNHALECLSLFIRCCCRCQPAHSSAKARSMLNAIGDIILRQQKSIHSFELLKLQRELLRAQPSYMHSASTEAHATHLWLGFLKCCRMLNRSESGEEQMHVTLACLLGLADHAPFPTIINDLGMVNFIASELEYLIQGRKAKAAAAAAKPNGQGEAGKSRSKSKSKEQNRKTATPDNNETSRPFDLGARVDGKFEINGRERWFPGVILAADEKSESRKYDVLYDDGDYKRNVDGGSLRISKNRKQPPEDSLAAIKVVKEGGLFYAKNQSEAANAQSPQSPVLQKAAAEVLTVVSPPAASAAFDCDDLDPLDESESGLFMSIPTTLPLKDDLLASHGASSRPKVPSLPTLSLSAPTTGEDGVNGRSEQRSSLLENVSERNIKMLICLLLRATTQGGNGRVLYDEGAGLTALAKSIIPSGLLTSAGGGEDFLRNSGLSSGAGETRLLKMLSPLKVDGEDGEDDAALRSLETVGIGNFGFVKLLKGSAGREGDSAIKLIPKKPKSDNHTTMSANVKELYAEISALQSCKGAANVVQLVDYGTAGDFLAVVTEYCGHGNMLSWRKGPGVDRDIGLYLKAWGRVCSGVCQIHSAGYIHHDLKCDNVLIRSLDFDRDDCVCICDFGECQVAQQGAGGLRARGTECVQSPEVVNIVERNKSDGEKFDRRINQAPTFASDSWQLGCLLFELIVGDYLFNGTDWGKFYLTVTSEDYGELPDSESVGRLEEAARSAGGDQSFDLQFAIKMIKPSLIRNPDRRMSAAALAQSVEKHFAAKE